MKAIVWHRSSFIWFFLMCATGVSWWLGADHGVDWETSTITISLMFLAFFKVHLVIQFFMEARLAPLPLKLVTYAYVTGVCAAVLIIYLVR